MFLDIVMGRKNQVGLPLSPRAVTLLDELAQQMKSSRAEVIEAIAQAQLALKVDNPQWTFHLIPEAENTLVQSLSNADAAAPEAVVAPESSPAPNPAPQETTPKAASPPTTTDATTPASRTVASAPAQPVSASAQLVEQLKHEREQLQTELEAARSQLVKLRSQLSSGSSSQGPAPQPTSIPAVASPTSEVTAQLREQLVNLKAAYAELETAYQQQLAENSRLQDSLIQVRQVATIGEAQLNRWQYKTFSR